MFLLSAFTSETVSRLTNLSVRRLHSWDRSGFFKPAFADSNTRRPHSRVYSFQDVVGLRTIARLLEAGVSLRDVKEVRVFFASNQDGDWIDRTFYVVDKRVYFSHRDAIMATRTLDEHVETTILEIGPVASDVTEAIRQLDIRGDGQLGRIERDRAIMSGTPVIAGTRIPTSTIAWFHRNGHSIAEIIEEFPRLTRADINAAIVFEQKTRDDTRRDFLAAS